MTSIDPVRDDLGVSAAKSGAAAPHAVFALTDVSGRLTRADVERHYVSGRADLFRLAWLAVGDSGVAEDLVQEAYARVWQRPERIRNAERLEPYLRSIVLNGARSRFATRARHRRIRDRFGGDPSGTLRVIDVDPMRRVDDREVVRVALDRLSPRQRVCVVSRYWLGLTDTEIADATGLAPGTVKTHLHRALATLRAELGFNPTSAANPSTVQRTEDKHDH